MFNVIDRRPKVTLAPGTRLKKSLILFIPVLILFDILVFMLDIGSELYIWVGSKASIDEKRLSLKRGHVSIFDSSSDLYRSQAKAFGFFKI